MADFDLPHLFTHHPPTPEQVGQYNRLRHSAHVFASVLLRETLPGADQSAALRLLRECVMTGNASIALGGRIYKEDDGC